MNIHLSHSHTLPTFFFHSAAISPLTPNTCTDRHTPAHTWAFLLPFVHGRFCGVHIGAVKPAIKFIPDIIKNTESEKKKKKKKNV